VVFVTSRGRSAWCKSEPAHDDGQALRLLLGHHDRAGLDVQVSFSIGGGQAISRCQLGAPDYRPAPLEREPVQTGTLVPFATIRGNPAVDLSLVFLVASEVQVGRNRLWHVRRELEEELPEPFRGILRRGRSGEIAA
jgi:hypothetical protein